MASFDDPYHLIVTVCLLDPTGKFSCKDLVDRHAWLLEKLVNFSQIEQDQKQQWLPKTFSLHDRTFLNIKQQKQNSFSWKPNVIFPLTIK